MNLVGAKAQLKPRNTITGSSDAESFLTTMMFQLRHCGHADVFESDTDLAVIPLENTIHGVVQETLRCFCDEADAESSSTAQSRWEIAGDLDLAVQHALVVRNGTRLEEVTWVGSHEQVRNLEVHCHLGKC
jgi:prephenate dehydratase